MKTLALSILLALSVKANAQSVPRDPICAEPRRTCTHVSVPTDNMPVSRGEGYAGLKMVLGGHIYKMSELFPPVAPPAGVHAEVVKLKPLTAEADKSAITPASTHSVTLACVPGSGGGVVNGYNFLRGTVSGGPYTLLVPGTATTCNYVDTQSLVEGTTYYYVTEATGPGGASGNSNQAQALIPFLPPAAPSGLSASPQ